MASHVENNLRCPTCCERFKDPVMLPCSHSFCRSCVEQCWEEKGVRYCPVCRKRCRLIDVPSNLSLKNVCEAYSQAFAESEDICKLHKEKLKLFCLDHQESVCIICRESNIHSGHKFSPLDEATQGHREKLHQDLQNVKIRLEEYNKIREHYSEHAVYIKVQRDQVELKIKKNFEELHSFLQVEEMARLCAVRVEERKKSKLIRERIEALSRDLAVLSDVIRTTEEQLASDHVFFMKNYKAANIKIQELPKEHKVMQEALLNEVQHVGNLKFTVWERMKETVSYSSVILDPNTAGPELSLSADLTSVSFKVGQQRPKNPERFKWNGVRSSALAPGTHTWDVDVGDNTNWELGLAWEDSGLPGIMHISSIGFRDEKYKMFSQSYGSWKPPVKLKRIRVHVDTKEKSLSFSESLTNTTLYTAKNASYLSHFFGNSQMYPFFYTRDKSPLKVIPLTPHFIFGHSLSHLRHFSPTVVLHRATLGN
ncbi:E3 ubiquitin-protein ligase TRIM35-like isoform X1 [Phycodurus eques]|uniref:E3 ubiquitin-protein ligase TRIM35-like isoform X1 n=1 Tax=Phycodurus eques TaxID=693459 RepID=UPI002ACD2A1B|nr:E3 ubiquitin-protein ligase TRIM35-like isoform X1 [Phycodurus eques]XP_061562342.1 E3 ubiquitin-protein ligase TRIM35-like isoform X1 [Phycodurus eques]XP_061562343.1 E3 ubiquitin-protein ligase TRIM35-like isoform X1 [Phycodurus eques]